MISSVSFAMHYYCSGSGFGDYQVCELESYSQSCQARQTAEPMSLLKDRLSDMGEMKSGIRSFMPCAYTFRHSVTDRPYICWNIKGEAIE